MQEWGSHIVASNYSTGWVLGGDTEGWKQYFGTQSWESKLRPNRGDTFLAS